MLRSMIVEVVYIYVNHYIRQALLLFQDKFEQGLRDTGDNFAPLRDGWKGVGMYHNTI